MDKKPTDEAKEQLNIKLKDQHNNEVFFKVLPTTPFRKVINAYCSRTGQSENMLRLLFNGEEINGDATPADMGIEDEDSIDVMVAQSGGFC